MRSVLGMAAALVLAATSLTPPPMLADALTPVALAAPASVEYVDEQAITRRLVEAELAGHGLAHLTDVVMESAADNYLDPGLILAVIEVESDFDPDASSDTSRGLMQLNDNTWPWLARMAGIEDADPMDPVQNIRMGAWYLAYLRDTVGSGHEMATAYNRGISGMEQHREEHGTAATAYSRRVLRGEG